MMKKKSFIDALKKLFTNENQLISNVYSTPFSRSGQLKKLIIFPKYIIEY